MKYAPVMIPTLCRFDKFVRCVESLKRNSWAKYTELYIAVDYPIKAEQWDGYNKICDYLEQEFVEFLSVHIYKRKYNYGPGKNSLELRNKVFEKYDRFIYTDDDIEFSPNFLEYIDKTMEIYEDNPNVIAVCGYSYPIQWSVSNRSNCFITTAGCFMWGTAFWKDKYLKIAKELENGILRVENVADKKKLRNKLIDARYIDMLELGVSVEKTLLDCATDVGISTYMELYDKYAVIPTLSKARNYGFDGTGVYCQNINKYAYNSREYDYTSQRIDENKHFEPFVDCDNEDINMSKWSEFDCRDDVKKRIFKIKLKSLLVKCIGKNGYKTFKKIIHGILDCRDK